MIGRSMYVLSLAVPLIGACCTRPLPCPTPAPSTYQEIVGDGQEPLSVSAPFGSSGGRLRLAPGAHPALLVPSGALAGEGRTFSLRSVESGRPGGASGIAVSAAFEVSPPTEARIDHAFHLSAPLRSLPADCTAERLRLAVERPNDVGPADGRGSPTLRWDYDRATWQDGVVAASVVRLYGQRMQFVCVSGGAL